MLRTVSLLAIPLILIASRPGVAADGDFEFVATVGSAQYEGINDVLSDRHGNIYYAGSGQNTLGSGYDLDLNPGPGTANVAIPASASYAWLVKLDQDHNYLWGVAWTNASSLSPNELVVDDDGNVYVGGSFAGTVDVDPGAAVTNRTALGGADAFLIKLNSAGVYQWSAQWGNDAQANPGFSESVRGIGLDTSGNVVVAGRFNSADIDADPGPGTVNLSPTPGDNIFIIQLNPAGGFQWAKAINGGAFPHQMVTDAAGNIYIAGSFNSANADFDPGAPTVNLPHVGSADIFVAKLDAAGNYAWAVPAGSFDDFEQAAAIAVDASGNVYATGRFRGDVDFDPGPGDYTITHSSGGGTNDIFVWKLSAAGALVWAGAMQSVGPAANEEGTAIGVDSAGNVLVGGKFQGTIDFDPGPGTATSSGSGARIFLARLDANRNYLWHGVIFDSGFSNSASAIHLERDGRAHVAGTFEGSPDFDFRAGTQVRASAGVTDGYMLTLDGLDPIVITESGGTAVAEGGAGDTYSIKLAFPNSSSVLLGVNPDAQLNVGVGPDNAVSYTFTTAANDWNTPRTVNVAAADDFVIEGAHTGTIVHTVPVSADPYFLNAAIPNVTVDIADNDIAGVVIAQSDGTTEVAEGGAADTVTLALATIPAATVSITITNDNAATTLDGLPGPLVLNFPDSSAALTPQPVDIGAFDDLVAEGAHNTSLTFTLSSTDLNYDGLPVTPLAVDITDNDSPGIDVQETGGTTGVVEAGAADVFGVALTSQPLAPVTLTLDPDDQLDLGAGPGTPVDRVFNSDASALIGQVVNVSAVNDPDIEGDHTGNISVTAASTDPAYDGLDAGILVDITDDDQAACDNPAGCTPVSGSSITVTAGEDVCLRVPDPILGSTTFSWSNEEGVLVEGRFVGVDCRTLYIPAIDTEEAGTYTALYDDGSKAPALYEVEVIVNAPIPVAGYGALLSLAVILLAFAVRARRPRQTPFN